MDGPNAIFYWTGFEFFVGMLWTFTFIRACSTILTSSLFPNERPLHRIEFWRYVLSTTLLFLIIAFILVIVSRHDVHHPIYKYPVAIARLFAVNLMAGLSMGFFSWLTIKTAYARSAKFDHPNLETWKGIGFWGPKRRKMTAEERIEYLKKMGFSDYLEFVRITFTCFAFFLFLFCFLVLMINAPMKGFAPLLSLFSLRSVHALIVLVIAALILGGMIWLLQRFILWLGWSRTFC